MPADIAIIVPAYDEADNVLPMVREVAAAFASVPQSYELVFVDDASKDGTWGKIQEAQKLDARVRGIRLSRNSGQSAALWTGIQATTSPIIATLDADLQNDPADLPKLLLELPQYDFACGVRVARQDNFVRKISSKIARWARHSALGVDFRDTGCALRVFKRTALDGVFGFNGLHRFLPVLVHGGGATVREVAVGHRPRVAGVSKYGVWNRVWRGIFDLVGLAWFQRRRYRRVPFTEHPSAVE
jgi:dolichol-phosphate mannosyltransferase